MDCRPLVPLLRRVVGTDVDHACFLNSLATLEGYGAKKIAGYVRPHQASLELLQHASEEARHAFMFRRLAVRLGGGQKTFLSAKSRRLLDRLELGIARLLHQRRLSPEKIRQGCYLLTTYAIELRAKSFYRVYEEILQETSSRISIRSILAEEENHLGQMTRELAAAPEYSEVMDETMVIEDRLFSEWVVELADQMTERVEQAESAPLT